MRRIRLGRNGPEVSAYCLGTMTWGTQTSEADGHAQIEHALARGVDFIDTAELYPVNPVRAETIGRTEEIIGAWFAKTGRRREVVLATKLAGEGSRAVRGGAPITPAAIRDGIEASLRRLRTDHIELYQFHWPNRGGYAFRQNWSFDPSAQSREATLADMRACLATLAEMQAEGKIGQFGLSNESTWGMAQWLALAETGVGPRALSIQNEYSLLCRLYDTDLAELGVNEEVMLMAYSPLGAGLLTGKYAADAPPPPGSRRAVHPHMSGRITPRVWGAIEAYHAVARQAGLDPVQMALAWVLQRPFPALPILGATTLAQLDHALGAAEITLDADTLAAIDRAHRAHPMPF